jgi:hypothetical protein
MKKVIISSCFLLFLSCFNNQLNLSFSAKANDLACIENNEHVAKIMSDPSKLDTKLKQIKSQLLTLILINSTLQEKLQLKNLSKDPAIFTKLLSELIIQGSKSLDVELDKVQALIVNLNIDIKDVTPSDNKSTPTKNVTLAETKELTEKIFTLGEKKVSAAVQKIAKFFHIELDEKRFKQNQLKELLSKTLGALSPAELKKLADMIAKPAFEKVINLLDEAAEITIRILSDS